MIRSESARRVVRPLGERAVIVDCADQQAVRALYAALLERPVPGQRDVVPAARAVLVQLDNAEDSRTAAEILAARPAPPRLAGSGPTVTIDVCYDGADLAEVGLLTGLGAAGVIEAHTSSPWTVAFTGFLPGFGYLVGGDFRLRVPRRASPRTRVSAGAVGLAGEYSGIYPRDSPGGWQLIGRTAAPLWSRRRDPPALLGPGMRVQFRAVAAADPPPADVSTPPADAEGLPGLAVLRPGALTTVQDGGRWGYAALGIPESGAADLAALRSANAQVGNPPETAALELTLGGLRCRAVGRQFVAIAGADAPMRVRRSAGSGDFEPVPAAVELADGDELDLGIPRSGLRTYLAVSGGVSVQAELGSSSFDAFTLVGPAPLRAGQHVPVATSEPPRDIPRQPESTPEHRGPLRLLPGPQLARVGHEVLERLCGRPWIVGRDSNRVAVRLEGDPLPAPIADMPSAPLVAGAVQLPPAGLPVVFGRDHPTTGGYPVVAVLTERSIDRVAQLRPGERATFAPQG